MCEVNVSLKELSSLKVGGICDVLFCPEDEESLIYFLKNRPNDMKVTILGNMSNVIISDEGVQGCVIRLGKMRNDIEFHDDYIKVNAGFQLSTLIGQCVRRGISCCEKLSCIPGTIGGAVFMNAGTSEFEIKDVLISVDVVDFEGNKWTISNKKLKMSYRNGNIPKDVIIISVNLKISHKDAEKIISSIREIRKRRLNSQPIGGATCGSTFKNPDKMKAWQLIKEAGCAQFSVGDAVISDLHCNFLINSGKAKASDFIELITLIRIKVFERTGIMLEEEIIKIGRWL
jgi:UDP-N-acetylmuramate dehydrogenase